MNLEIEKPDLISVEMKAVSLIHKLANEDVKAALEIAGELRAMVEKQRKVMNDWKALLFAMANKL